MWRTLRQVGRLFLGATGRYDTAPFPPLSFLLERTECIETLVVRRRGAVGALLLAVVLALGVVLERGRTPADVEAGRAELAEAYRERSSGVLVESDGRVDRILSDDREGTPHQRFILRLSADHTVLVSHNLDLAPRVPVGEGEIVRFRGQYEWNEQGGVVHWTHHDPRGERPGGWIRHQGVLYR